MEPVPSRRAAGRRFVALEPSELSEVFEDMTLVELASFVKKFEETFHVTAAAPATVAAVEEVEGQGEPDVALKASSDKKIRVMGKGRALPSLNLKEIGRPVRGDPKPVLEEVAKDMAEKAKERLDAAGTTVFVQWGGDHAQDGSFAFVEMRELVGVPGRAMSTDTGWSRSEPPSPAALSDAGSSGEIGLEALVRQHERAVDVPEPVLGWHAQQNAALREELLQEFGALTPSRLAEVAESRSARVNDTFYNWTRHNRVVAVEYRGRRLVPGFYITPEGLPDDLAGPVIAVLGGLRASRWQQALWWTAPRWQFDGRRAVDVLLAARTADRDERARVGQVLVAAADEPRDFF